MSKLKSLLAVVLLVALCACLAPAALAATTTPSASEGDATEIANRYSSLEGLAQSEDESDQVVTSVTVGVLTAANRALDGATVTFSGEVIGDTMRAENGYVWVNVLGASGASIGVRMSEADAEGITYGASYSTTGTTLQIKGVYSVACAEHEGELDVHATEVVVTDAGGTIEHSAESADVTTGLAMCIIGLLLLLAFFICRSWYDYKGINDFDR